MFEAAQGVRANEYVLMREKAEELRINTLAKAIQPQISELMPKEEKVLEIAQAIADNILKDVGPIAINVSFDTQKNAKVISFVIPNI